MPRCKALSPGCPPSPSSARIPTNPSQGIEAGFPKCARTQNREQSKGGSQGRGKSYRTASAGGFRSREPIPLDRSNLHPYRRKVKHLHNLVKLEAHAENNDRLKNSPRRWERQGCHRRMAGLGRIDRASRQSSRSWSALYTPPQLKRISWQKLDFALADPQTSLRLREDEGDALEIPGRTPDLTASFPSRF